MIDSVNPTPLSLEQFEERLLDGDRWIELVKGRFVRLTPPDDVHGDVVRNLSMLLATTFKTSRQAYACFELPLVLQHEPATIRCPAISIFPMESEGAFAETDKTTTETRPLLIVEVASSNDRREGMSDRVRTYLEWGVGGVWVVDPVSRHVHVFDGNLLGRMLKETEILSGQTWLPGLSIVVADLFKPPSWLNRAHPI